MENSECTVGFGGCGTGDVGDEWGISVGLVSD